MRSARFSLLLGLVMVAVSCAGSGEEPGSVGEALGFGDPDDPSTVFDAQSQWYEAVEELILACMVEQGFEYEPQELAPSQDPRRGGDLTMEEYRQRFGYGMMSSLAAGIREEEGWTDPNAELRAGMDEATHLAWQVALFGEDPLDDDARDGCRAESEDRVNAYMTTDAWLELETYLDDLEARIAADPRTIEAASRWAQCMAEAGYPFANEEEAISFIGDETFDRWEREPHPETGRTPPNRWSIAPWFLETDTWADLVELELDIVATADVCGEDPRVRAEYEQQFLEQHADLLEEIRELR